jgi:hypothetical protein
MKWKSAGVVMLLAASYTLPSLSADNATQTERWQRFLYPAVQQPLLVSKFLVGHPAEAVLARAAAVEAMEKTVSRFGHLGRADESAAYFHFLWAGLATLELHQTLEGKWTETHPPSLYYLLNPRREETAEERTDRANELLGFQAAIRLFQAHKLNVKNLEDAAETHKTQKKFSTLKKEGVR